MAELAFLGYHLHWSPTELMSLEHADRRRWVAEVSTINAARNDTSML
jgi:hypothetical protein